MFVDWLSKFLPSRTARPRNANPKRKMARRLFLEPLEERKVFSASPIISTPGSQSIDQDTAIVFADWLGDSISISDDGDPGDAMQVTLAVSNGTLGLANTSGITIDYGGASGYGSVQFTGALSDIDSALNGLTYTPNPGFHGADDLQITVDDLADAYNLNTDAAVGITVNSVIYNQAPSVYAPGSQGVDQNSSVSFASWQGNQISVSDPDAGYSAVQVTLSVSYGYLNLANTSGLSFSSGYAYGYSTMQFSGTLDDINNALNGMSYSPSSGYTGGDTLSITIDDLGNSGAGGNQSATSYVGLSVNPPTYYNQAPSVNAPGSQGVDENSSVSFASWQGNQISVSDPDAGYSAVQVTLSVSYGYLNLAGYSGLSFSSGYAYGYSTMQFSGTLDDINNALNGMSYSPSGGYTGGDTLSITIDDLGNSGAGGNQSATSYVGLSVNSVTYNQAPSVYAPGSQGVDQNSSVSFASWQGNQVSVSDPDAGYSAVQVTLSVSYGYLNLAGYSGLSFSSGYAYGYSTMQFSGTLDDINNALNGMSYSPSGGYTGGDTLSVTIDDLGNSGAGGNQSATSYVGLSVNPPTYYNQAPSVNAPGSQGVDENSSVSFANWQGNQISVSDPDAGYSAVQVTLSASYGYLNLANTSGLSFSSGYAYGYSTMQFSGTLDDINNALNGMSYSPSSGYTGGDTLSITIDDLGNSGAGGNQSATSYVGLSVNPPTYYNQAPSVNAPGSQGVDENSSVSFANWQGNQISVSDPDAGYSAVQVTLSVSYGYLNLAGYSGLSFSSGWAYGYSYLQFSGTLDDINNALNGMSYSPSGGYTGGDTLSITIDDLGNSGAGGNQSATSYVGLSVNALVVNHAPAGADASITINEDAVYVFSAADFGFSDNFDSPANYLAAVQFDSLPLSGNFLCDGITVLAGQFVSVAEIDSGKLTFSPAANEFGAAYGLLTFRVQDDGGTSNGGIDLDTSSKTLTLNVDGSNDAPSGTSAAVTTIEDSVYTFTAADFGFYESFDSPANGFDAVVIASLPASGALRVNGFGIVIGQSIAITEIDSGNLKFTPAANASGNSYASFTFQVQDDGGTASGGANLDPVARTMTVNVTPVNDAPSGANKTVTTNEDTVYIFQTADFGFSDSSDSPANQLAAVKIASLPAAGRVNYFGVAVTAGQVIPLADILAGRLRFKPAANASGTSYASFTFQVRDDGGTASGGANLDPVARTMNVNVTPVNDAPSGANKTVTTNEDTVYIFQTADFGFSDSSDSPANQLAAVKIASLPAAGRVNYFGVAVTAGQVIPLADILAGRLRFKPEANASGAPYASFTFQVQDDGGTASGGANLDPVARTMTVNVTPVNDAPSGANKTVTTNEDTVYIFQTADFGFSDSSDSPANQLAAVKIASLPAAGRVNYFGVAVTAGQVIPLADILAGRLRFKPAANAAGTSYASFTFQVQDDGGTASGGANLDPVARTMTVNVTPVNDAPSGANGSVATLDDSVYIFRVTDFGFTDSSDLHSNNFSAVRIGTLPSSGRLNYFGVAVRPGQVITVADIVAGRLRFKPTPEVGISKATVTQFTFYVRDDGGIANGGMNEDVIGRTMSVNVSVRRNQLRV